MYRVRTGGRIHLGLLSLPAAETERRFGGVGLMIDAPALVVRVEEASEWGAEGPLAARALEFAQRISSNRPPRKIIVEQSPPEHVGLGVGTQLGLAVARALTASWGIDQQAATLARWIGRGHRSALGVHGFEQGGFLVEGGKTTADLSPLVARMMFPDEWRVVYAIPSGEVGRHGPSELTAFERLRSTLAATERMCRLVLLGMLPALAERDILAFGEAAFAYNAQAGEMFADVQGGTYASAAVADLVAWFRREGVRGVGQSSWGPGVFAFVEDEERGRWLAERVPNAEATVARGLNCGATA